MSLENLGAETGLIGSMMFSNDIIDTVADIVDSGDFSIDLHGRLFETILSLQAQGSEANPVTLRPFFADDDGMKALGGVQYLANLYSEAGAMLDPYTLAKQVNILGMRRRMRDGLKVAATACEDMDAQVSEIMDHADKALTPTAKAMIAQPTAGEALSDLLESYNEPVQGVTCKRIPSLDRLLGPIRPKQLVIGAGRPGMGKTAMALSYSIGASRAGHGVLYVSLEMSGRELAARMASDLCFGGDDPIAFSNVRDGNLSNNHRERIIRARNDMLARPFSVIDAGSLTLGRLNMLVRRHKRRMAAMGHKLELVVIDYLQLLHPDTKGRSNYEAVSEISRGLKAMAKDNDIAVFALAQLSREVEKRPDRRPQLSDLRDSGQIEQDADAVLFLLRQEYYLRQEEVSPSHKDYVSWQSALSEFENKIEFIVAKRRNGVTGRATGEFYGKYQAVRG